MEFNNLRRRRWLVGVGFVSRDGQLTGLDSSGLPPRHDAWQLMSEGESMSELGRRREKKQKGNDERLPNFVFSFLFFCDGAFFLCHEPHRSFDVV